MKPINLLSTVFALGLATTVTAGTMYVTAKAAVQQEQDNLSNGFASGKDEATAELVPDVAPPVPVVVDSTTSSGLLDASYNSPHDIVLDAAGGFRGRLNVSSASIPAPAKDYKVKILQGGVEVAVVKTDADGQFTVVGLKPGVTGIIAIGDSGLLLFGARLVQAEVGQVVPESIDLTMDVVAHADAQLARELISGALSSLGNDAADLATSSNEASSVAGSSEPYPVAGRQLQLSSDGTLQGQINVMDETTGRHRKVQPMEVHFLRDGKIVASANVDPNGRFTVSGLNPGMHSMVGVGKDGVFALGVEILGSLYEPNQKPGDAVPVSLQEGSGGGFSVSPVGPNNLNAGNAGEVTDGTIDPPDETQQPDSPAQEIAETPPAAPGAGGGAPGTGGGGSTGGGGGGIGGGGGLGGLLGAAAGGALGYALGRDNKDASPGN